MALLLHRFNNTNKSLSLETRVSSIETFLQSFSTDMEYLLQNLTLKNFNSAAIVSLKGKIKTGDNSFAELNNGMKIEWGNVLMTPTSVGVSVTKKVVFNKAFSKPPSIFTTPYTSVPQNVFCSYTDRSEKEFKLVLSRNDTTPTTISWIAIGI